MAEQFLQNPAYVEYIRQLVRLHELVDRGESESDEAEVLREAMDSNWYALNAEEIERAGIISADLDMLSGDEVFRPVPPEQRTREWFSPRFLSAWEDHRWDEALALLRTGPPFLFENTPEFAAFFRARCYSELGHHDLAYLFMAHAAVLAPQNPNYAALALAEQFKSGDVSGARERAEEITSNLDADARLLFMAALVIYRGTRGQSTEIANSTYAKVISILERGLNSAKPGVYERSQTAAYIMLGVCYDHLGQKEHASDAYDKARRLDPEMLRASVTADDLWRRPLIAYEVAATETETGLDSLLAAA